MQSGTEPLNLVTKKEECAFRRLGQIGSTHLATIRPGILSIARSASRARYSRLRSLTCGTSRKIGTVVSPRPVFALDA